MNKYENISAVCALMLVCVFCFWPELRTLSDEVRGIVYYVDSTGKNTKITAVQAVNYSAGTIDGARLNIGSISHNSLADTGTNTHDQIDSHISATGASVHGLGDISTINLDSTHRLTTDVDTGNWNTAYSDRLKWDGGATGLTPATGRTSLELGTMATQNADSVAVTGGAITGITDLAIADGGTGASDAATARTNLGAAAIVHTHTSDSISDATSSNTANMIVKRDGSGNFSAGTITATLSGNATNISGDLPAAQVTQTSSLRFVTDVDTAGWNGKQAALTSGAGGDIPILSGTTIRDLKNSATITWSTGGDSIRGDVLAGAGTVTNIATTAPITGGPITETGTIAIPKADGSTDGYLDSASYTTFNAKEPAITAGTTAQYLKGDKSLGTLNQAAVAGLTTSDSPTFSSLTTTLGATVTGDLYAQNMVGSGMRGGGLLINGDFSVCQRQSVKGTIIGGNLPDGSGGHSNNANTLDCWYNYCAGVADTVRQYSFITPSYSVATDTPTDGYGYASNYCEITNAIATPVLGTNNLILVHHFESADIAGYANSPMTLSFWAEADTAQTYAYGIRNAASTKSYVNEFTLAADAWTKITHTFTMDTPANFGPGDSTAGMTLTFALTCGSANNTSTLRQWFIGNKFGSTTQSNFSFAAGQKFRITNVKLEPGSVATPFVQESYNVNLDRCRRRLRCYISAVTYDVFSIGMAHSGTTGRVYIPLQPPMRATPTLTLDAAANWAFTTANGTVAALITLELNAFSSSANGVFLNGTTADVLVAGNALRFEANNKIGAYIYLSSEL